MKSVAVIKLSYLFKSESAELEYFSRMDLSFHFFHWSHVWTIPDDSRRALHSIHNTKIQYRMHVQRTPQIFHTACICSKHFLASSKVVNTFFFKTERMTNNKKWCWMMMVALRIFSFSGSPDTHALPHSNKVFFPFQLESFSERMKQHS